MAALGIIGIIVGVAVLIYAHTKESAQLFLHRYVHC